MALRLFVPTLMLLRLMLLRLPILRTTPGAPLVNIAYPDRSSCALPILFMRVLFFLDLYRPSLGSWKMSSFVIPPLVMYAFLRWTRTLLPMRCSYSVLPRTYTMIHLKKKNAGLIHGMGSPWGATFASYGWVTCPLASCADGKQLVTDNFTGRLSLGIPHPQYGVMRATVVPTPCTSLARLSLAAQEQARDLFSWSEDLPLLFVGAKPFVDCVGDAECAVLGVLVYGTTGFGVEYAPLALVDWHGTWLPYFEDANNWVMTGWDTAGRVTAITKPFGWGGALLGCGREDNKCSSSRASCA